MTAAAALAICERIQLALVDGTADEAVTAHVGGCEECAFVAGLSSRVRSAGEAPAGAAPPEAGPGEAVLGRYLVERVLGRGGQGVVYAARDLETDEAVAIKLVRAGGAAEVAIAHRIHHPNVCRVYHGERHGALWVLIMERVDGRPLSAAIPMPARQALPLFRAIADGVHAGHAAGVLHLDLKPDNVLVRADGTPVVMDFGLAVVTADDAGGASDAVRARGGTRDYMAPEARRGAPVDRRADVYALGVLLERMIEAPPRWVRRLAAQATAADPAARPPTAAALVRAVDGGGPRRRRLRRAGLGLLALVAAAGVAFALVPPPGGPWNVARDAGVRVVAEGRAFGCARSTAELVDGITQYSDWQHGFAFPGREAICVELSTLPYCGERDPSAPACEAGGKPGQLDPASDCRETGVVIDLGEPRRVERVTGWYHGPDSAPAAFRVQVERDGAFHDVFVTRENRQGMDGAVYPPGPGASMPVTVELVPVETRRVRLVVDPCSTLHDATPGTEGDVVWLYELEVFARVGRLEAWRRALF